MIHPTLVCLKRVAEPIAAHLFLNAMNWIDQLIYSKPSPSLQAARYGAGHTDGHSVTIMEIEMIQPIIRGLAVKFRRDPTARVELETAHLCDRLRKDVGLAPRKAPLEGWEHCAAQRQPFRF